MIIMMKICPRKREAPSKCSYKGCQNNESYRGRRRRFPVNDPPRLAKWLKNCGAEHLKVHPLQKLVDNFTICSDHFKIDSFRKNDRTNVLRRYSIPIPHHTDSSSTNGMAINFPIKKNINNKYGNAHRADDDVNDNSSSSFIDKKTLLDHFQVGVNCQPLSVPPLLVPKKVQVYTDVNNSPVHYSERNYQATLPVKKRRVSFSIPQMDESSNDSLKENNRFFGKGDDNSRESSTTQENINVKSALSFDSIKKIPNPSLDNEPIIIDNDPLESTQKHKKRMFSVLRIWNSVTGCHMVPMLSNDTLSIVVDNDDNKQYTTKMKALMKTLSSRGVAVTPVSRSLFSLMTARRQNQLQMTSSKQQRYVNADYTENYSVNLSIPVEKPYQKAQSSLTTGEKYTPRRRPEQRVFCPLR